MISHDLATPTPTPTPTTATDTHSSSPPESRPPEPDDFTDSTEVVALGSGAEVVTASAWLPFIIVWALLVLIITVAATLRPRLVKLVTKI